MNVTLKCVAERARLSVPTVSHILSKTSPRAQLFRPATRERVRRAAEELGYRPNTAARATVTGRFNCVTLLLSTVGSRSLIPSGLLEGLDEALAARGQHLMLARLDDDRLTDATYVPGILRQLTSDGLLINYNAHIPDRMRELIAGSRLPHVWINSRHEADCVHPDDFAAAVDLTRRLLAVGHRRIAFVDYTYGTAPGSRHYSNTDRRAGYVAALQEAGCAPRFIEGTGNIPLPERIAVTDAALLGPDSPTALLAYTGHELAAVLAWADRAGLRIPERLSVVAFHDAPLRHFELDVTTALIPEADVGREAARQLLDRLDGVTCVAPARAVPFGVHEGRSVAGPGR